MPFIAKTALSHACDGTTLGAICMTTRFTLNQIQAERQMHRKDT